MTYVFPFIFVFAVGFLIGETLAWLLGITPGRLGFVVGLPLAVWAITREAAAQARAEH